MITTIMLISWMPRLSIHCSVYGFESGYTSSTPSLSFFTKTGAGEGIVSVSTADCLFKETLAVDVVGSRSIEHKASPIH